MYVVEIYNPQPGSLHPDVTYKVFKTDVAFFSWLKKNTTLKHENEPSGHTWCLSEKFAVYKADEKVLIDLS